MSYTFFGFTDEVILRAELKRLFGFLKDKRIRGSALSSPEGAQQGTGVGHFMSRTIIEKNMGGKLSVCNGASGAVFRIEV